MWEMLLLAENGVVAWWNSLGVAAASPLPGGAWPTLAPIAQVPPTALVPLGFGTLLMLVLRAAKRADTRAAVVLGTAIDHPGPRGTRSSGAEAVDERTIEHVRPAA